MLSLPKLESNRLIIVVESLYCKFQSPKKKKAEAALYRFQKLHKKYETERTLHLNNLDEPELISLVLEPHKLISALANHPAVLNNGKQTSSISMFIRF